MAPCLLPSSPKGVPCNNSELLLRRIKRKKKQEKERRKEKTVYFPSNINELLGFRGRDFQRRYFLSVATVENDPFPVRQLPVFHT